MEWVQRAGEWRTLAGKRDLRGSLTADEQTKLGELEHFFCDVADSNRFPFQQREQVRAAVELVVTFAGVEGKLRDVSGEGAFVETALQFEVGARTVMRIIDCWTGDEWRFGAEVVRTTHEGVGLKFVGIPLQLRLGHRSAIDTRRAA
jgi:hypothetical protein